MRIIHNNSFVKAIGFDTFIGSLGLFFRALIQAIYLVIVSRAIGVDGYGFFAGVVAVSILLSPLSGWGCSYVVTRKISAENISVNSILIPVLMQVIITGTFLLAIIASVSTLINYISLSVLLLIGISELILLPIVLVIANIGIALRKSIFAAIIACVVPVARLLSLLLVLVFMRNEITVDYVCWSYFAGSLSGIIVSMAYLFCITGAPEFPKKIISTDMIKAGGPYAMGSAVSSSFMELDKVIVLHFLGSAALGLYSLAFRVSSIFILPLAAFGSVVLPRIFAGKVDHQWEGATKILLLFPLVYGVIAGAIMCALAPLVPLIFGNEFAESVNYLRLLALWPVLHGIRSCLGVGLVGAGLQSGRLLIELAGLITVVLLNVCLISKYGVVLTIYSLLASEFLMAIFFFYFFQKKRKYSASL